MQADTIVIGAGVIGAACARALSRSGQHVVVLDRGPTAGGTSASGEGNLLVSDKGPGAELVLAQYAATLWPSIVTEAQAELGPGFPSLEYDAKGGLVVATTPEGAGPLHSFAAEQIEAGVDARTIDLPMARELEPELHPSITAAVHYPEDAQIQPVIATEALLGLARRSGADVRPNSTVVGAVTDARGRLTGVRTDAGVVQAPHVVLAAGPWSGAVAADLGVAIPIRPRRGMVLVTTRMPHRIFHKVYDADYVGAVESSEADLQTSSVIESTAAGTVLIGSSRQQIGFDDRLQVDVLREIAAKAVRIFPFLSDAMIMRAYGGFRPYVPDHLPVIGADHRLPGLFHASGHEGAGIGLSVATAELIAAEITGASPPVDPAPYRLDRASLREHLVEVA